MSAAIKPITMYRNAGWSIQLVPFQDIQATVPFPLAGYSGRCQLRSAELRSSALLADIIVTIDAVSNIIILSISKAVLSGVTASQGFFDVLLLPAAGDPWHLDLGGPVQVYIEDGITV
jgi:hypothetical protein